MTGGGGHLLVFLCYGRWPCTGFLGIQMRGLLSITCRLPRPALSDLASQPAAGHIVFLFVGVGMYACLCVRVNTCTHVETRGFWILDFRLV